MLDVAVLLLQDFLKNNRGIDDGSDLPEEYMSNLYDRIINDEIKMKVRPCACIKPALVHASDHRCFVLLGITSAHSTQEQWCME